MIDVGNAENSIQNSLYVLFELNVDVYAINIEKSESIERLPEITRVPDSAEYIVGIINLRGDIIPVISLKKRFGISESNYTEDTKIIVVSSDNLRVGFIVDKVIEIVEISSDTIQPVRNLDNEFDNSFLAGMYDCEYGVVMLLDPQSVLKIEI